MPFWFNIPWNYINNGRGTWRLKKLDEGIAHSWIKLIDIRQYGIFSIVGFAHDPKMFQKSNEACIYGGSFWGRLAPQWLAPDIPCRWSPADPDKIIRKLGIWSFIPLNLFGHRLGETIWTDDWNHWLDLIACCFMAILSGKVAEFGWNMVKHLYRQLKMVQWHNIHCLGKRNTWPASYRPTELVWCGPIYKAWFNGLALIGVYSTYGGCL